DNLYFDPGGTRLADTATADFLAIARLWDLTAPGTEPLVLRRGDSLNIDGLAFEPSGRWLATAQPDGSALWPLDETYPQVLARPEGLVFSVAFTPDGKRLVSSGRVPVQAWPLSPERDPTGQVLVAAPPQQSNLGVAIDPASGLLAVGGPTVRVVPLAGGPVRSLEGSPPGDRLAFSDDGRLLAAFSFDDGALLVWNLETGRLRTLPQRAPTG